MVLVELGDGGFEGEFAARDLQPLDEIGRPSEEHAPAGFGEMAFEPASAALGDLVFEEGGEKACRRPALLVGLGGERRPDLFDGRRAQLGEQQRSSAAAPPRCPRPSPADLAGAG